MKVDIAALRREYSKSELDVSNADPSPFLQFQKWFDEALKGELLEPNAMVVATAGGLGPTQRTVLMKAFDDRGLVFFTNYESRKAQEISTNPQVCALFPWYALERQVAITGAVEKISKKDSLAYFLSRPTGSQLGAWVSQQSQVISSRSILETKLAEMKRKFSNGQVPLPDFWGGMRIIPDSFEFWQGRKSRLHDRLIYRKSDEVWKIERLSP